MEANTSQGGQEKTPIPKFKKRVVSAVRDWPPGCGPAAGDSYRQIAVVSLSDSVGVESLELQVIRDFQSSFRSDVTRSGQGSWAGFGGVTVPISTVDSWVHHRRRIMLLGSLWSIGGSATALSSELAKVRYLDHDVISGGLSTALGRESAKVGVTVG
ncbi:hypothetical protein EPI10_005826 [Gossypium australe]|uniref:Uncharacterized protein n=1 Tax=Gossypium australe TaxID=47621 RepID=A0A5B6WQQ7_9ROSI|nr:hypothetical protein EPI10_005826 [Gossypium australe]